MSGDSGKEQRRGKGTYTSPWPERVHCRKSTIRCCTVPDPRRKTCRPRKSIAGTVERKKWVS